MCVYMCVCVCEREALFLWALLWTRLVMPPLLMPDAITERERERERERARERKRERERERERENMCVCMRERDKESDGVCERGAAIIVWALLVLPPFLLLSHGKREREREREREKGRKREREKERDRER